MNLIKKKASVKLVRQNDYTHVTKYFKEYIFFKGSFSFQGTPDSLGINPRALRFLFGEIAERVDWEYSLSVSLMEIYNESLKDLLNAQTNAPLEIKQGQDGVFVPGLKEIKVNNVDDVDEVRINFLISDYWASQVIFSPRNLGICLYKNPKPSAVQTERVRFLSWTLQSREG